LMLTSTGVAVRVGLGGMVGAGVAFSTAL